MNAVVVLASSSLALLVVTIALVREVRLRRTEGLGYRAIATRLTGEAIKTKTGLSCWCHTAVARIESPSSPVSHLNSSPIRHWPDDASGHLRP